MPGASAFQTQLVRHYVPVQISETLATPVRRQSSNPLVRFGSVPGYGAIFNAGLLYWGGRYHLFARGVRSGYTRNPGPGPRFLDYVSDILVFESHNGADFTFVYRLFDAGHDGVECYEDPRVQVVRSLGEDHIVMTYTNLPPAHTRKPWRIGAHRLTYSGNRFHMEPESGTLLGPGGLANKDAVVFNLDDGRVALIHRIHPDMQLAVFDDLEDLWCASDEFWAEYVARLETHVIISPTEGSLGVGAGAPPVETPHGLLLFFHERNSLGIYTMKVALLDSSTGVPIVVHGDPLMVPELDWERWGDVDDVIFVQGAHVLDDGDTIFLTYGAADGCVGGATTSARAVLDAIGHT